MCCVDQLRPPDKSSPCSPRSKWQQSPQSVSSTFDPRCTLHQWLVFPLRSSTEFFADAAFPSLRAHAAEKMNSQFGLLATIRCAADRKSGMMNELRAALRTKPSFAGAANAHAENLLMCSSVYSAVHRISPVQPFDGVRTRRSPTFHSMRAGSTSKSGGGFNRSLTVDVPLTNLWTRLLVF